MTSFFKKLSRGWERLMADDLPPAPVKIEEPKRVSYPNFNLTKHIERADLELAEPPPGVLPSGQKLAMDSAIQDNFAWANTWSYNGTGFPGFSYLAELTQIPEYRRPAEIIAKEMTRKWMKLISTGDSESEDKTKKLGQIEAELKRLDVQAAFRRVAEQDGYFGRSQIYLDFGDIDDRDELLTPLIVKKGKVGKNNPLKALRVIEPIWTYPNKYDSQDPMRPDYYKPQTWFVMGKEIHSSRLLTFVSRQLPDLLKPAYAFAGLSLSQMAKPYVDNWLRTRQSVSDAISNFSVMVLLTDLQTVMQSGGEELIARAEMFNQLRDNRALMIANKESEDLKNVSMPLGGLDHLQAQSQEHMAAVTGIPLVKLLGITPSGLNASSDGEIRAFYDWIEAQQEGLFTHHFTTILNIVQLSLFNEIDPEIGFKWEPLWSLDEVSLSNVVKTQADTDVELINAGVISPQEARVRLAAGEDSPYASLDLTEVIEPPAQPGMEGQDPNAGGMPGEEGEQEEEKPNNAVGFKKPDAETKQEPAGGGNLHLHVHGQDADFDESKHKRNHGKFAKMAGSGAENKSERKRPSEHLSESDQAIEQRLDKKIDDDFDGCVQEYSKIKDTKGGKVLNTDIARELSPDYLEDRTKSAAVHEPSSAFIKKLYAKKLKEKPKPGEIPLVMFTAGGTEAGKSTAIDNTPDLAKMADQAQIVYDTNMNKYESSKQKIQQALDAGKHVHIAMVVRDPEDALVNGALPRAERQRLAFGSGRTVPIHEHIKTHLGSMDVIKRLSSEYADNPNVTFDILDNSLGKGNQQVKNLEWLHSLDYPDVEGRVGSALEREYENGKVHPSIYRGFSGKT